MKQICVCFEDDANEVDETSSGIISGQSALGYSQCRLKVNAPLAQSTFGRPFRVRATAYYYAKNYSVLSADQVDKTYDRTTQSAFCSHFAGCAKTAADDESKEVLCFA